MKKILVDLSSFPNRETITQAIKIFDCKKKKGYVVSVHGSKEDLITFRAYPDIVCIEKESEFSKDEFDYIFISDHSELTDEKIDYTVLFETGNDTSIFIFEEEINFSLCANKKRIGVVSLGNNITLPEGENRFELIDPEVMFSGAFDAIFILQKDYEIIQSVINGVLKKINSSLDKSRAASAITSYFFKNYMSAPKVFTLTDFVRENRLIYIDGIPYYVPARAENENEIVASLQEAVED